MLNFKKETIFKRKETDIVGKNILHSGVLAVWGASSSGKTIVATKIAKYLAGKQKNVILVLCDMTTPMMQCIANPSQIECEKSLGNVLGSSEITSSLIKFNLATHKKYPYLTMLGMLKGENEYTYAPYGKRQAEELIKELKKIAPFIIIDCGSYIANDILSAVALLESDSILRLTNPDLKSVSYLSSQLKLLENSGFDVDKQYKIMSNIKPIHSIQNMDNNTITEFKLPYSKEIEMQYLVGNLFEDLQLKDGKIFKKQIEKIVKEVFEC